MKARAQELKAEERANKDRAEGERAVLAAIAEMKKSDRTLATRVHKIVEASAPSLWPKTWYGMPAYTEKFNARYATFGFEDAANLDKGSLWPVAFALKDLTATEEAKIRALVRKAAS